MKSKLVKQAFQEKDDQDRDYYEGWLLALEKMVLEIKLVSREEVENRTAQVSVK
jgi:Nitrile hydratase beta subunit